MRIFLACGILCFAVHGFLLEPDHTSRPGSNNQCLTIESFLLEKKAIERHSDQTINVLTSQLQTKFSTLEKTMAKVDHGNDTLKLLDMLEKKYDELAYNFTLAEGKRQVLETEVKLKDSENAILRNVTNELKRELSELKKTKAVQSMVDLQSFQQQMNSVQQQINLLTNNQNARNQDFLALYNLTFESDSKMMDQLRARDSNITKQIKTLDSSVTHKLNTLDSKTMNQFQNIERNNSLSFREVDLQISALQKQVSVNSEKVALTACVASGKIYRGPVIFGSIKTNTGINNIDAFRSTGKFKVTTSGLYFISAYIRSKNNNDAFSMKINGNVIVSSVTSAISGWSTSSIVSIVAANTNDEIYVDGGSIYIDEYSFSCISIIKVK